MRPPSPALVISVIALFVSLGGVSYGLASGSIGSREIKNNSIRGKDVRDNSLGGRDIREARLGTVPDAARLGGSGPDAFLRQGAPAGGALAGSYPQPSIAAGAVTPDMFGPAPAVRAYRSTNLSIPDDQFTIVPLDAEAFDVGAMHNPATPSRLTMPRSGLYELNGAASFFVATGGTRTARILKNGGETLVTHSVIGPSYALMLSTLARLEAGDYLELQVYHDTGSALTLSGFGGHTPALTARWVGPAP